MSGVGGSSRLGQMKAQFQQKQMQEKEAKLLQMLDNQQQRVAETANGVLNKLNNNQYGRSSSPHPLLNNANSNPSSGSLAAGKVRQMFEERRKGGPNGNSAASNGGRIIGIDKSYPLEPIQVSPPAKSPTGRKAPPPPAPPPAKRNTIAPPIRPSNLGTGSKPSREPSGPTLRQEGGSDTVATSDGGGRVVSRAKVTPPSRSRLTPTPPKSRESPVGVGFVASRLSSAEDYPPVATTTKYRDYASELEKREAGLADKLKGLNVTEGPLRSSSLRSSPLSPTPPPPTKSSTSKGGTRKGLPSTSSTSSTKSVPAVSLTKLAPPAKKIVRKSSPAKAKHSGPPPPGLDECKVCGRYFANDRIGKHESICKKVIKKRKTFDPTKMRMEGTEAEPYIRVVTAKIKKPPASQPQAKKVDWRKQHEEFIATIRAAKEYSTHVARGGDPNDLPPPPPSDNSDYIQCPHCLRKFSQGAGERHIPKCNSIKSNKKR